MCRLKKNWSQGGNTFVRALVRGLAADYDSTNPARKRELAYYVGHEIKRIGGRFLKQNENGDQNTWEEVLDETARKKISKHFRNI
jgi:hypothetical protein